MDVRPRFVALFVFAVLLFVAPLSAQTGIFFTETGFTLDGRFLEYWRTHGGLEQFGYPISPVIEETVDGKPRAVQYFERSLFELHPENAPPYDVLLARLGVSSLEARGINWRSFPRSGERDGCRFFAETGHQLCEPFASHWESHGGLAVFGLPLSDAHEEQSPTDSKTYLVQYFERNRMEFHPENPTLYRMQLGLLGSELYSKRQGAPRMTLDPILRRLIELTNSSRQAAGLAPLTPSPVLMAVAGDYSRVLASRGTISHIGPDGSDASSRLERAGYRWSASAENLAAGQSGADDVFASWMSSPHHRANILDPRMREIGVGHMLREGDPTRLYNYWVMELARPS